MINPKADGDFHGRITIFATIPSLLIGLIVGLLADDPVGGAIAMAIGCLCGLFMDPDLDQFMVTRSEMRVIDSFPPFSWFFGGWWVGLWIPYAKMVPHRSVWSHGPLIGTAIRIMFVSPVIYLGYLAILQWFPSFEINDILVLCWSIGLAISDFGHFARDKWGLTL